ncbi:MAG: ATP-binding protein [Planctomycetota bacterium]
MSTADLNPDPVAVVTPAPTADDLAGLVRGFSEATERLMATHETLSCEVRRLQGELARANEELERSRRLAALGEMAAGIAHEVRNPLGSITLYARLLEEDLADRPEQKQTASKIRTAVRGLDAVVTDVLHFSKEMRPGSMRVGADDLIERAVEATRGHLAGLAARVEVEDGLELTCDPDLVHRAIVNLVRNAADAMSCEPGEHELRLTAKRDASGAWVRLGVMDTGPGVPAEVRERMFNPFFTTRAVGTGLGLPIVHRIADAHGGRVEVRNRSGKSGGASVTLVLPAAAAGGSPADAFVQENKSVIEQTESGPTAARETAA